MKTKLALAAIVLSLTSSSAFAEWVQVYPTPPEYNLYYDSASVTRQNNLGGVLSMASYVSPQTDPNVLGGSVSFYSRSEMMIFDCTTREVAGIGDFMFHSGQFAGGDVVFSASAYDPTRRPVNPGTANEAMYQVACR